MRRQNVTAVMEYREKITLATSCLQRSYHKKVTKTALQNIYHPKILQKFVFMPTFFMMPYYISSDYIIIH